MSNKCLAHWINIIYKDFKSSVLSFIIVHEGNTSEKIHTTFLSYKEIKKSWNQKLLWLYQELHSTFNTHLYKISHKKISNISQYFIHIISKNSGSIHVSWKIKDSRYHKKEKLKINTSSSSSHRFTLLSTSQLFPFVK